MTPRSRKDNYLQECLRQFSSICRLKYGTEFDLVAVEEKVRHLRRRTPLTYSDLAFFESPEHWWFQRFWVFPPRERIEPALEKETFDFWNLPESREGETIRKLLYIFKSIELVSIILRFVRPEHYSIYSAPVQHRINQIANMAFLTKRGNIIKNNEDPESYFPKVYEKHNGSDYFVRQQIPYDLKILQYENYGQFIDKRAELLVNAINEFMSSMKPGKVLSAQL